MSIFNFRIRRSPVNDLTKEEYEIIRNLIIDYKNSCNLSLFKRWMTISGLYPWWFSVQSKFHVFEEDDLRKDVE